MLCRIPHWINFMCCIAGMCGHGPMRLLEYFYHYCGLPFVISDLSRYICHITNTVHFFQLILYLPKNKRMRLYSKDGFPIIRCTINVCEVIYTFGMRLYLGVHLLMGKYSMLSIKVVWKQKWHLYFLC